MEEGVRSKICVPAPLAATSILTQNKGPGTEAQIWNRPCDIQSRCCSFTGPWTVTRSSLRMLRLVAAFCRPLGPVLLLVLFPRSRSPVVGALGLCWMWQDVPFVSPAGTVTKEGGVGHMGFRAIPPSAKQCSSRPVPKVFCTVPAPFGTVLFCLLLWRSWVGSAKGSGARSFVRVPGRRGGEGGVWGRKRPRGLLVPSPKRMRWSGDRSDVGQHPLSPGSAPSQGRPFFLRGRTKTITVT